MERFATADQAAAREIRRRDADPDAAEHISQSAGGGVDQVVELHLPALDITQE